MKLKTGMSCVVKPKGKQERLFRCGHCGKLFMKVQFLPLLPVKCPHCGSFRTGEDRKVSY